MDCDWLILAPKGYQVMIQFTFLNIETDSLCQNDFVEFVSLANRTVKRCGDDDRKRYISPNNYLIVKFHSDQSTSFEGFTLRYLFVSSIKVSQSHVSLMKSDRLCENDEWKCNFGSSCIPKLWFCDHIRDCRDNSDELFCAFITPCHQSQVNCLNGQCIPKELWCNGMADCSDHSDETNCHSNITLPDPFKPTTINSCSFQAIQPDYVDIDDDNSQIVGGRESIPGSWPWMVSLRSGISHACGGSLISDLWILTAAHCFIRDPNPNVWTVDLGRYFLYSGKVQTIDVEKIIIHPKFNVSNVDSDIALVKLKRKVKLTASIQTVCLPERNKEPIANRKCVILGWGYTKGTGGEGLLKQAIVPIVGRPVCNMLYRNIITNQMICAGYPNGGIDSCEGDSGGPLVCKDNGKFVIYGISSWGAGCALANKPGVYTNVIKFLRWIRVITREIEYNSFTTDKPALFSNLTTNRYSNSIKTEVMTINKATQYQPNYRYTTKNHKSNQNTTLKPNIIKPFSKRHTSHRYSTDSSKSHQNTTLDTITKTHSSNYHTDSHSALATHPTIIQYSSNRHTDSYSTHKSNHKTITHPTIIKHSLKSHIESHTTIASNKFNQNTTTNSTTKHSSKRHTDFHSNTGSYTSNHKTTTRPTTTKQSSKSHTESYSTTESHKSNQNTITHPTIRKHSSESHIDFHSTSHKSNQKSTYSYHTSLHIISK